MEVHLDWKSIGSLLATFIFIKTAIHDFLPPELYQSLKRLFFTIFTSIKPKSAIIVEEFENSFTNELFDNVQTYLSSKCFDSAQILKLSKPKSSKNLTYTMDHGQNFEDEFDGIKLNWSLHVVEKKSSNLGYIGSSENRYFQLTFHRKFKDKVHKSYIPHVMEIAEMMKFKSRERKLYTNRSTNENGRLWSSVPFTHPSTFDTVAMDPDLKNEIKSDLMKFVTKQEFYSRVGRAWKRGYLLYGPPGTGKTTLIAAIANFLKFDIYDLELTAVRSNSQLRKLLISTSDKSVIIVEDIDCSLDLSQRKNNNKNNEINIEMKENYEHHHQDQDGADEDHKSALESFSSKVSLSGVLNFVDGLWSSCGGERLMIFTTNHKEKLDQALLRPGRMDKHIHLSYCEISAFKILMKNYLGIEEHELVREVEELLPNVEMTPAEIGEVFMGCEEDSEKGMRNVVEEMRSRVASTKRGSVVNCGELEKRE